MRRVPSVVSVVNNKVLFRLRSEVSITMQRATFCALRTSKEAASIFLLKKSIPTLAPANMEMSARSFSNIDRTDDENSRRNNYEHENSVIGDAKVNTSNSNNNTNGNNSFTHASASSSSSLKDDKATYFDVQDVDPSRLEHFYWNASSIDADNDDMDNEESLFSEISELPESEVPSGSGENDHWADISRYVNPAHYNLIK